MQLYPSLALFSLSLLTSSSASALPYQAARATVSGCTLTNDLLPTYIGQDKNVLVQTARCAVAGTEQHERRNELLEKRQNDTNVCGAQCDTNCFPGATGGPTTGDCHVIADALLYDSQNVGALFNISSVDSGNNQIIMTFQTCKTFFLNQSPSTNLTYCRSDWSELVDWLSTDCSATNSAHGGNCVAVDQSWFVQVQAP